MRNVRTLTQAHEPKHDNNDNDDDDHDSGDGYNGISVRF